VNVRSKLVAAAAAVAVLALGSAAVWKMTRRADIVVGGKDFTEQEILTEMLALLIEGNTDLTVARKPYLGGTMVCFNALKAGDLDLYAEYTGTGLVNILDRKAIPDPQESYSVVKQAFAEQYRIAWLEPFGFNNTYTLTLRRKQAEELGIETFSDLAEHVTSGKDPALSAGFTAEFLDRPDGYKGLAAAYGLTFASEPKQLDPGLMYRACSDGSVDVICAFATDGRIAAYDLAVLEDDRRFFPPYFAAPLVRQATLAEHPELEALLNRLAGRIDDQTMQKLNYQVDRKDEPRRARDVARDFLQGCGLLPDDSN
jgi:glycine betaine/choline ABC-type transport system substrate-binding protein